ncbi:MAG: hypothetical protein AAF357_01975, partial [Verrucomicrobiota bacterium]
MKIEEILSEFPPVVPFKVGTEATFYGAANNVASKLDLPGPSKVSANWMHGWHPSLRPDPEFYYWSDWHRDVPLLVWTAEQADLLCGIFPERRIRAVGAPFLYARAE